MLRTGHLMNFHHRTRAFRSMCRIRIALFCCAAPALIAAAPPVHAPAPAPVQAPVREHRFSGEQDGQYSAGEYRSDSTTIVKKGRELAMAPGSVILFKKYAGLKVEGRLVCRGTPEAPVVFRPVGGKPGAGQWNGIAVTDSAEIDFDYVKVIGSVLCLTLGRRSHARLRHTIFEDNLHGDVTIGDSVVTFLNDIAGQWNYGIAAPPPPRQSAPRSPALPASPLLLPIRAGLASVALAGGALWFFFDRRVAHYQQTFNDATTTVDADRAHDSRDRAATGRTISAYIGIGGAAAAVASITIPIIVRQRHAK